MRPVSKRRKKYPSREALLALLDAPEPDDAGRSNRDSVDDDDPPGCDPPRMRDVSGWPTTPRSAFIPGEHYRKVKAEYVKRRRP